MSLKVAFLLFNNVGTGMGTENVVMQYCKYSPPDIEITIYQNEVHDTKVSEDRYDFGNSHPRIVTMKGGVHYLGIVNKFPFGYTFFSSVILPIYYTFLKITPDYRKLRDELKQYDIIYDCQNFWSFIVPKGPIVVGSPHNFSVANTGLFQRVANQLVGRDLMWRRIDVYHMYSRGAWFLDKYNKKGFVLDNGTRFEPVHRVKIQHNPIKFGFATRLEECKGILKVVDAFEIVKQKPMGKKIELHIYGEGYMYDKIPEKEGISKYGWVRNEDIPQILSSLDCVVYPTTCDNYSLAVIEALSAGCYVIASDRLKGVFDKFEQIGVLEYCPPEVNSVVEKMENFLNSGPPDEKSELSRQLLLKDYSWKSIAEKLFTELYKLAAR